MNLLFIVFSIIPNLIIGGDFLAGNMGISISPCWCIILKSFKTID